jgi:hypothetical protein
MTAKLNLFKGREGGGGCDAMRNVLIP